MGSRIIETTAHTTTNGFLQLELDLGIPNADVAVTVRVIQSIATDMDSNGWPVGFFEKVAGSMPDLVRMPQGDFEERMPLS